MNSIDELQEDTVLQMIHQSNRKLVESSKKPPKKGNDQSDQNELKELATIHCTPNMKQPQDNGLFTKNKTKPKKDDVHQDTPMPKFHPTNKFFKGAPESG